MTPLRIDQSGNNHRFYWKMKKWDGFTARWCQLGDLRHKLLCSLGYARVDEYRGLPTFFCYCSVILLTACDAKFLIFFTLLSSCSFFSIFGATSPSGQQTILWYTYIFMNCFIMFKCLNPSYVCKTYEKVLLITDFISKKWSTGEVK